MTTPAQAFLKLSQAFHDSVCNSVKVSLNGEEIVLQTIKGKGDASGKVGSISNAGSSKKVYSIGNGRAMALLNMDKSSFDTIEISDGWLQCWQRMLKEEKTLSDKLKAAGLLAVDIKIDEIEYAGGRIPVSIMPHFEAFAQQGIQVRDYKKNEASQGHSMLFGSPENIESQEWLLMLMRQLKQDISTLACNGYALRGDALSLAIVDTEDTPNHDRQDKALFDIRNQQLRLFFFDLASHEGYPSVEKLTFLDERGDVSEDAVQAHISHEVDRVFERVLYGVREGEEHEIVQLSQGGYDRYTLYDQIDANFKRIKPQIVEEIKEDVMKTITAMDVKERRELFSVIEPQKSSFSSKQRGRL